MHPELGNQEFRTTAAIKARLEQAGLAAAGARRPAPASSVTSAPGSSPTAGGRAPAMLALRADIDALPIPDTKTGALPLDRPRPRARLRARRAHHRRARRRARPRRARPRRACCRARCGCSSSPPRRCCPAAPPTRSSPACWTASAGSSPCTATRKVDAGRIGLRVGPDHLRLRPAGGRRSTAPAATPPART